MKLQESAVTGEGLDEIGKYMESGKTIVFMGSSGVGKSTLLNKLADRDIMYVNDIREDDSKGRHTTTHRQLVLLPSGGMIIDTCGVRGRNTTGRRVIILEFVHFAKHFTFTVDGEDFRNKKLVEGIKVLVVVRI